MQPKNVRVFLGDLGARKLFQRLCADNGVEGNLEVEGFSGRFGHGEEARFLNINQRLDERGHQVPDLFSFLFLSHGPYQRDSCREYRLCDCETAFCQRQEMNKRLNNYSKSLDSVPARAQLPNVTCLMAKSC